jgi:hypothetical protein
VEEEFDTDEEDGLGK